MSDAHASTAASDLDVVIASVGRPSLLHVVDSIRRDAARSEMDVWVRVFLDTASPDSHVLDSLRAIPQIEVRKSPAVSPSGAGAAYGAALSMVAAPIFSFFSDDDEWVPGRLRQTVDLLSGRVRSILIQRVAYSLTDCVGRPREDPRSASDLLHFALHKPFPLSRNARTLSLLGVSATRDLAAIPFDPSLSFYEDVWWLYCAGQAAGHKGILVDDSIVARARTNSMRTRVRLTEEDVHALAARLTEIDPALGIAFQWHLVPRTLAMAGCIPELPEPDSLPGAHPGVVDRLAFEAYRLLARLRGSIARQRARS